jgi:hypothetical protein
MLHPTTFEYLKPTDTQMDKMAHMRRLFSTFVSALDNELPDGADKAYIIRLIRDAAMWTNITLTRTADGTPRS